MEERIWDGLGFLPPDNQHVLAMLPQGDIVLEEVHNQRAFPIKVEEVCSYLRAFADRVRLRGKERRKKLRMLSFLQHALRHVKVLMSFDPVTPVLGCCPKEITQNKEKHLRH